MLRSMYSGISGLKNFQTKLDVIGNNIANVNTYGFKKGRTVFKDLISQSVGGASAPTLTRGGVNPKQIGLGSQIAAIDTIHTGGSTQFTGNTLDLALSGDGFFQVADGTGATNTTGPTGFTNTMYTRAGNFYMDQEGYLVNGDGKYLVGNAANVVTSQVPKLTWRTEAGTGAGDGFQYLIKEDGTRMDLTGGTPGNPDEGVRIKNGKLFAGADSTNEITVSETAGGQTHPLQINSAGNLFITKGGVQYPVRENAAGNVVYMDGKTEIALDANVSVNAIPGGALLALVGTVNASVRNDGLMTVETYDSGTASVKPIRIPTTAQSMSVGQDGTVTFVDDQGKLQWAGQLVLAKFPNPGGLEKVGSNYFQQTSNSGIPVAGIPTTNGLGEVVSGFLEMSNVDLSEEFTEMIVAQRGFQANTRIITTSDEILQELVNLKR